MSLPSGFPTVAHGRSYLGHQLACQAAGLLVWGISRPELPGLPGVGLFQLLTSFCGYVSTYVCLWFVCFGLFMIVCCVRVPLGVYIRTLSVLTALLCVYSSIIPSRLLLPLPFFLLLLRHTPASVGGGTSGMYAST